MSKHTIESILKILDGPGERGADNCALTPLSAEMGAYFVAGRLTCINSSESWALLLERVCEDAGSAPEGFVLMVDLFAPDLPRNPSTKHFSILHDSPRNHRLFDEGGVWTGSGTQIDMVKGSVQLPPNPIDYAISGITPHMDTVEPVVPTSFDVYAYLARYHRSMLFLDPIEVTSMTSSYGSRVLQLDNWQHPITPWQYPSDTETFRQIARVLVTGNPMHYQGMHAQNANWRSHVFPG